MPKSATFRSDVESPTTDIKRNAIKHEKSCHLHPPSFLIITIYYYNALLLRRSLGIIFLRKISVYISEELQLGRLGIVLLLPKLLKTLNSTVRLFDILSPSIIYTTKASLFLKSLRRFYILLLKNDVVYSSISYT